MDVYHDLLRTILDTGTRRDDRTGVGTLAVFGHQARYDLTNAFGDLGPAAPSSGFPLITTKKLHWKSIAHELLWFVRGETNNNLLREVGVTIWDEWADPETGELGPIYGRQWRAFPRPEAERSTSSARRSARSTKPRTAGGSSSARGTRASSTRWPCPLPLPVPVLCGSARARGRGRHANPLLPALPAVGRLLPRGPVQHRQLRAAHLPDGPGHRLPAGEFIHTLGDAHLYMNHIEQARTQLERQPRPLPTLSLPGELDLFEAQFEDIEVIGYDPHPAIRAEVAV